MKKKPEISKGEDEKAERGFLSGKILFKPLRKITIRGSFKKLRKKMFSLKERDKNGNALIRSIIYFCSVSNSTYTIPCRYHSGYLLIRSWILRKRNISKAVPFILYPSFSGYN